MATNTLSTLALKIRRGTTAFLIGKHRVTAHEREDFATLISGLALWGCVLLDQCTLYALNEQEANVCKGRILNIRLLRTDGVVDLTPSLAFLDHCNDFLLEAMSMDREFKVHDVLNALIERTTTGSPWFAIGIRTLCEVLRTGEGRFSEAHIVRELLQCTSLLRKICVDRPDLDIDLKADYLSHEWYTLPRTVKALEDPTTQRIISEMNELARVHCADFSMKDCRPKHGNGVVSTKGIISKYEKYLGMKTDRRIDFMLRCHDLGTMRDYNPVISPELSTRTSRFIGVPKTWKKLRGIAAEPIELQFFQQAVFSAMDRMFCDDPWWRRRVDLHSQGKSQELALQGSKSGRFATIDLSAASDSVSLELVKQVFKGTPLLPWLLCTRSTFSEVDNMKLPLLKFSTMGSACCFPVECAIFALAAQVASGRTPGRLNQKDRVVRVFGDDIIVESVCVPALLDVLDRIGFTVNQSKSYWSGPFREACGTYAFRGGDVRPYRYSHGDLTSTSSPLGAEEAASLVGTINQLWMRGYQQSSRSILEHVLKRPIRVGTTIVAGATALQFALSDDGGCVASSHPTNFHLRSRWNRDLQRSEVRTVVWKRVREHTVTVSTDVDIANHLLLVEWLIAQSGNDRERPTPGDLDWEPTEVSSVDSLIKGRETMLPTQRWVERPLFSQW